MTKRQIIEKAQDLGYMTNIESNGPGREQFAAHGVDGKVRVGMFFAQGRFDGGYTVDYMGHVMSHRTMSDVLRFIG